ncbi:hypothetical protein FAI41_04205 [Acetobacteraceae bacterium]|nr:hypothetical protein FAI41_04205 [Acetobacteraceae bacterium]
MPQKPLISFFLPFSFSILFVFPAFSLPVFAAETTTLPIETHTLSDLTVPPKAKPTKEIISFSQKTQNNEDAQRLTQMKKDVTASMANVASKKPAPFTSSKVRSSPPHPSSHMSKTSFTPRPSPKAVSTARLKTFPSDNRPDHFELGGVKLGMTFAQARSAIANYLGINLHNITISGSMPEPQTCTADTQLSAEGEKGAINVQFACNAGLPLHQELSVDHISYEPETGLIENVLDHAVKKYGNPVNLSEYNPLKAEYVSYDWCLHPSPDLSSQSGKALHCLNRNESRLRLQGRDNSLEFELIGIVGAAKNYEGDSEQDNLAEDDEA